MDSLIPHKLNLSIPQLKKLLKGHAVQLSKELIGSGAGDKEIHLTPTNAKKLMRAYNASKGMRLTLGPNEMSITGGNIKSVAKDSGKKLITVGTDRAIRAIEGSGYTGRMQHMLDSVNRGGKYSMFGGNVKKTARTSAKKLINAGTERAIKSMLGGSVNRLNKATRWEGFSNRTLRDAIDTAGKAGRVYNDTMSPVARMGFGNITKTAKSAGKRLIMSGTDRAIRAIDGSGLYGYGMEMRPAVMPPSYNRPKLGKGVATRSKVYRTAMRRNMGVDIDNASVAKPPGGRYNSAVRPASSVMTMSPFQGSSSPAMHPFVPMTAYQNSGVSYNIR